MLRCGSCISGTCLGPSADSATCAADVTVSLILVVNQMPWLNYLTSLLQMWPTCLHLAAFACDLLWLLPQAGVPVPGPSLCGQQPGHTQRVPAWPAAAAVPARSAAACELLRQAARRTAVSRAASNPLPTCKHVRLYMVTRVRNMHEPDGSSNLFWPCLACPQVHHRIVDSLLQLVEAERSGEAVNRHLLKHAVDMLTNLRLYEDGVQETLLSSATQYYSREGCALINVRMVVVDCCHGGWMT